MSIQGRKGFKVAPPYLLPSFLDALVLLHFLQRCIYSQRSTVWTVGGYRLHNIRHCQNPEFENDVVSTEPQWISRSIEPFMVLMDHFRHLGGKANLFYYCIILLHMTLQ